MKQSKPMKFLAVLPASNAAPSFITFTATKAVEALVPWDRSVDVPTMWDPRSDRVQLVNITANSLYGV